MKLKLILLVFSFFLLAACASKKKVVKIEKTAKESSVVAKIDSVFKHTKSLSIKDTVFISLKTNNKIADSIVNVKLQNFYTSKTSGNNSYSASFDTIKKGLKILTSIKSSSTTEVVTNKEITKLDQVINSQKELTKTEIGFGFSWWWFLVFLCLVVISYFIIRSKLF